MTQWVAHFLFQAEFNFLALSPWPKWNPSIIPLYWAKINSYIPWPIHNHLFNPLTQWSVATSQLICHLPIKRSSVGFWHGETIKRFLTASWCQPWPPNPSSLFIFPIFEKTSWGGEGFATLYCRSQRTQMGDFWPPHDATLLSLCVNTKPCHRYSLMQDKSINRNSTV